MTDIWSFDSVDGWSDGRELVGCQVEATDGEIGKIDASTTSADHQHVVVDTGFWIFGKKRMIPAGVITRIDADDERVYFNLTKGQIKDAPDFDEMQDQRDEAYYGEHGSYYDPYRPIM